MFIDSREIMLNDRSEQVRLALSLVECLGMDGAISACRSNGWGGVLQLLTGRDDALSQGAAVADFQN